MSANFLKKPIRRLVVSLILSTVCSMAVAWFLASSHNVARTEAAGPNIPIPFLHQPTGQQPSGQQDSIAFQTDFAPAGWVTKVPITASISVTSSAALLTSSVRYRLTTSGDITSAAWVTTNLAATTSPSTTAYLTVTNITSIVESSVLNQLQFAISDTNGISQSSTIFALMVDTVAPASSITNPVQAQVIVSNTYVIQGTASDATSGINAIAVFTDSGAAASNAIVSGSGVTRSWAYTWQVPSEDNLAHTLWSRAIDVAGNAQAISVPVQIFVDNVPPATSIVAPAANSTISATSYLITGTAYDNSGVAQVWVRPGSGGFSTSALTGSVWSFLWSVPITDGVYALAAIGVDTVGNRQTLTTTRVVTVDHTSPVVVHCTSPANSQVITSGVGATLCYSRCGT